MSDVSLMHNANDDLTVVNAARVSFNKESSYDIYISPSYAGGVGWASAKEEPVKSLKEADVKLINYLAKHNHFTPFTHCWYKFEGLFSTKFVFKLLADKTLAAGFEQLEIIPTDSIKAVIVKGYVSLYSVNFILRHEGNGDFDIDLVRNKCPHALEALSKYCHLDVETSPLDVVDFCVTGVSDIHTSFRICMPIAIARQWFKHQIGFNRNELSRRYVSDAPTLHEVIAFRKKSDDKKQGSSDEYVELEEFTAGNYEQTLIGCVDMYEDLISQDVCPEQARFILPLCTNTQFVETSTVKHYERLFSLRIKPDAQLEIQKYAEEVRKLLVFKYKFNLEM